MSQDSLHQRKLETSRESTFAFLLNNLSVSQWKVEAVWISEACSWDASVFLGESSVLVPGLEEVGDSSDSVLIP